MTTTTKILDAASAWRLLARIWSSKRRTVAGLDVEQLTMFGLCWSIMNLPSSMLDLDTELQMLDAIKRYGPPEAFQFGTKGNRTLRWPLGDRPSRAEFCRAMAERVAGVDRR